jgi:hypothetical protein
MSDPTIAFLAQPLAILAQGGRTMTDQVLHTLSEWVRSKRTVQLVSHGHKNLVVLESAAAALNVVLIARGHRQGQWTVDVCALDDGEAGSLASHFEPLIDIDHIAPSMELKFKHLDVMTVLRGAESLNLTMQRHHAAVERYQRVSTLVWNAGRLLEEFEKGSERWASSKARNNFKALMDEARERPQVVERDGDDLLVVSRQYLKEAVDPTSAQSQSRRYRAMALSDSGMTSRPLGALPALQGLPEIGAR